MAGFKTHLTVSTLMGVGYGSAASWFYHVSPPTCVLAGGLCAVSGMLPDIDSDSGRPLRESIAFAAAIVPMMLIDRLGRFNLAPETLILTGAFIYLAIRFGAAALIKKLTVHRGMFHSLPAAAVFGGIAFLLASGDNVYLRYYKAGGVVLGYLSHLLLDEFYSIEWYRGRLRLKKSFGTAVKILGHGALPNLAAYGALLLVVMAVIREPGWMPQQNKQSQDKQYASQSDSTGGPSDGTDGNQEEHGTLMEALKSEFGDPTSWLK